MVKKRAIASVPYEIPVTPDTSPYTQEELDTFIEHIKYEGNPPRWNDNV
jgi:hypothetical protein